MKTGIKSRSLSFGVEPLIRSIQGRATTGAAAAPRPESLHVHIPALDGIRGLAILLVMLYHFSRWAAPSAVGLPANVFEILAFGGWIGVDLFFVLSGFLISGILLDTLASPRYFQSFFVRRTLRVWPLYYGVLIAVFVAGPVLGADDMESMKALRAEQGWLWAYATNLVLARHDEWVLRAGWLEMGHFWSLAVEEHFYLVWPFVVFLVGRHRLGAVCLVGIVVAVPVRYVLLRLGVPSIGIYVLTPCRVDALLMGGLLATMVRKPGGPAALVTPARWGTILAVLTIAVVVYQDKRWLDPRGWRMQQVGYSAIATAFGGLLVLAINARSGGSWHRLWTCAPLRTLGRYSYGLYVYHFLFGKLLEEKLHPFYAGPSGTAQLPSILAFVAASVAASLIVAVASYHIVEMPFLRLKRYFAP